MSTNPNPYFQPNKPVQRHYNSPTQQQPPQPTTWNKYGHAPVQQEHHPPASMQHTQQPHGNEQALPECECGDGSVTLKTCAKGKPENQGKQFFACKSCNGFMWALQWDGAKKMRAGRGGGTNEAKTNPYTSQVNQGPPQHNHDHGFMMGQLDAMQQSLNKVLLYTRRLLDGQGATHTPNSLQQPSQFNVPTLDQIEAQIDETWGPI